MARTRGSVTTAILRASLNRFLSGLCAGETVATATQKQGTGKEGSGEEGPDGGESRPFHGVTGLLA